MCQCPSPDHRRSGEGGTERCLSRAHAHEQTCEECL
uniref:Uncharacterized protein n=1 Tax=Brassica campestris TaxID=3711 RepID=A0A3P5Z4X8_BRACM|nr:unnamed protein product [Brassica rapa]